MTPPPRPHTTVLAALAVLLALAALAALAAPPAQATAQSGTGADCTEADPCVLRVTLDGSGVWFDAPGDRDATVLQHRWYTLDVLNQFDEEHTLTLGNRTLAAPGYDGDGPRSRHGPFPFAEAGDLTLRDTTARATATVHVEAAEPPGPPEQDPTGSEAGEGEDDRDGNGDAPEDPTPGGQDREPPQRRKEVPGTGAAALAAALGLLAHARTRR